MSEATPSDAKKPPQAINPADVANAIFAARRGLQHLDGADLANAAISIVNLEDALKQLGPRPSAAAPQG